jgi:hypothetical protein
MALDLIVEAIRKLDEAQQLLRRSVGDKTEPTVAVDFDFLDRRLDSLDFGKGYSVRARNAFAAHTVFDTDSREFKTIPLVTVRDLVSVSKAELLREPNVGLKTIESVEVILAAHGLRLAP